MMWLAVLACVPTGILAVMVTRAVLTDGLHLSYRGDPRGTLRWRRCKRCDGCGALLHGGIIPKEVRTYGNGKDGGYVNGKTANVSECPDCRGLGGTWQGLDGTRSHVVIDRNVNER